MAISQVTISSLSSLYIGHGRASELTSITSITQHVNKSCSFIYCKYVWWTRALPPSWGDQVTDCRLVPITSRSAKRAAVGCDSFVMLGCDAFCLGTFTWMHRVFRMIMFCHVCYVLMNRRLAWIYIYTDWCYGLSWLLNASTWIHDYVYISDLSLWKDWLLNFDLDHLNNECLVVTVTAQVWAIIYSKVGGWIRLIVGFQPLMVISPTASWIRWCMQVYAWWFYIVSLFRNPKSLYIYGFFFWYKTRLAL